MQRTNLTDEKAVFATVESPNVVPARARIGGTVASLSVRQGDAVTQGQVIAVVGDEKLLLQINSLDAQIAGLQSQLAQAQTDLARAETLFRQGAGPRTTLDQARTAVEVAASALRARTAERAVAQQNLEEGQVLAPVAGRVLTVPLTRGTVVLNGDTIATIGEQPFLLRLRMPERHAVSLKPGDPVRIDAGQLGAEHGACRHHHAGLSADRGRPRGGRRQGRRPGQLLRRRPHSGLDQCRHAARLSWCRPISSRPASAWTTCALRRPDGSVVETPVQRGDARPSPAHAGRPGAPLRRACRRRAGAPMNLGLSGRLTRATIRSPLTPLFLLAALAAGLVALLTIPREEEPQISVPMVDIIVQANGLKAPDAVELVTKPLEAIVKPIAGVEHVYSQTQDDRAVVTVRFNVGTNEDDAVLRVNDKIRANIDKIPIGIPEPLIVGRGINDVAVVVLTLSPQPAAAARWTDKDLYDLAVKLRTELTKVDNIGTSYIVGTGPEEIRVEPDPEKLSLFGVTLQQLIGKVRDANREFVAGSVRDAGMMRTLAAGQTLRGVPDIGLLLLTTRDGRPVYVRDVAKVVIGPSTAESRVWNLTPDERGLGARAGGQPGAGQARRRQRGGGVAGDP